MTEIKGKNSKALDIILRNAPYCLYMQALWLVKNNISPRKIDAPIRASFLDSVIAWSPDSTYLAVAKVDTIAIIDVLKNTVVKSLEKKHHGITSLSWCADSVHLASDSCTGTYIWSREQESPIEQLADLNSSKSIHSVAWHPEQVSLLAYSCCIKGGAVKTVLCDRDKKRELEVIHKNNFGITSLVWNRVGTLLACGDDRAIIDIVQYTAETEDKTSDFSKLLTIYTGSKQVESLTWHPDNVHLACGTGDKKWIKVWNCMTGEMVSRFGDGDKIHSLAWSPDGGYLVCTGFGNAHEGLFILNSRTHKLIKKLASNKSCMGIYYEMVAWSRDGKYFAAETSDFTSVWPAGNEEVNQACHQVENLNDNFDPRIAMIVGYHASNSGQKFEWNEFPQLLPGARRLSPIIQKLLGIPSYWGSWLFRLRSWIYKRRAIIGTSAAVGLTALGVVYLLKQKKKM